MLGMASTTGVLERRLPIKMATVDYIEEVFDELNFPSSQKLKRVLDSRGIAYDREDVEKLVRREAVRQVQAPGRHLVCVYIIL